jgi:hypothetical protein
MKSITMQEVNLIGDALFDYLLYHRHPAEPTSEEREMAKALMRSLMIGEKIYKESEILTNLGNYIRRNVGSQDHNDHIDMISGYIAGALNENVAFVVGSLKAQLKIK